MDNIVKFLIQQGKIGLGYNVVYTVLDKVHKFCRTISISVEKSVFVYEKSLRKIHNHSVLA